MGWSSEAAGRTAIGQICSEAIQEQLGLRLEATAGPVDPIVIDGSLGAEAPMPHDQRRSADLPPSALALSLNFTFAFAS
jgi:hypothetical protein